MVHLRSSFRFLPDTVKPCLFLDAHHGWLLTTAAQGGLQPASAGRLRGTLFPSSRARRLGRTVVGVTHHLVARLRHDVVQRVEIDIAQQGADAPAVWACVDSTPITPTLANETPLARRYGHPPVQSSGSASSYTHPEGQIPGNRV
jgi:hypothetical protein